MSKIHHLREADQSIETSISLWRQGITAVPVLLVVLLMGYFWIYKKNLPENSEEQKFRVLGVLEIGDWGAFGDFIGGVLNPLVAFAAFYWLTQSVKYQRIELAKTQEALAESASAQKKQAENSNKTIRIAACTALAEALQSQIDSADKSLLLLDEEISAGKEKMNFLTEKKAKGKMGWGHTEDDFLASEIDAARQSLRTACSARVILELKHNELANERDQCIQDLRNILLTSKGLLSPDKVGAN